MKKILVILAGLALAGMAQAQIKCWTDADGKRACGDTPPPGAKVRTLPGTSASSDAAPAAAAAAKDGAAKDAKKGPLTPAEREQESRKKQAEAQKAAAKADQERKDNESKTDNCQRAREALTGLESGQRIQRIDPKGERYFLDDAQREQETVWARQVVKQNCN